MKEYFLSDVFMFCNFKDPLTLLDIFNILLRKEIEYSNILASTIVVLNGLASNIITLNGSFEYSSFECSCV